VSRPSERALQEALDRLEGLTFEDMSALQVQREVVNRIERQLRSVCSDLEIKEVAPADIFIEEGWATNVVFSCNGVDYVVTFAVDEKKKFVVSIGEVESL
jgi:hypothetical protein